MQDEVAEKELDGYEGGVELTRNAFKHCRRTHLLDFIPNSEGVIRIPVMFGMRVYVPDSVYRR